MVNVIIIEDDVEVSKLLTDNLSRQSDLFLFRAAESMESFLNYKEDKLHTGVVLLDIGLPGMSGISGIPFIKERYPELEIIMLTVHRDWDTIFRALKAGASGYVLKTATLHDIKEAIDSAATGESFMSPAIARMVIDHFQHKKKAVKESNLSTRERELVQALVDGLSYKQIADRLSISIQTVRVHIRNIYSKLQVHSKAEVIGKFYNGGV